MCLFLYCFLAFIQIFPPLTEMGDNMLNNFCCWAEKRKEEISQDAAIADKATEIQKLDDRMGKFKEKMSFLAKVKESYEQAVATKTGMATC